MNASKKRTGSIITGVLFVLALALLLFSTIGGTRAALTYGTSLNAELRTQQSSDVAVLENGVAVAGDGALLTGLTDFKVGQKYDETVAIAVPASTAQNETIEAYVRASVYVYWTDKDGNKNTEIDPGQIEIEWNEGPWIIDTNSSTKERTVLYYSDIVTAGSASAPVFTSVRVNPDILRYVTAETENGVSKTVYAYDGYSFNIEVVADAVQTHNATAAMQSAWGVNPADIGLNVIE